jgi:hypothetical protein
MLYMKKNMNLLDLNNDILNITGDYVKQDNKYNKGKERRKLFLTALIMI